MENESHDDLQQRVGYVDFLVLFACPTVRDVCDKTGG